MTTQCPNCMGHGLRASGYCNRPGIDGRGVVYSNCPACEGTGVLDWSELARDRFGAKDIFKVTRGFGSEADTLCAEAEEEGKFARTMAMIGVEYHAYSERLDRIELAAKQQIEKWKARLMEDDE